ncbi:hypothetical protein VIGAN_02333800 [Vigna angularis var. angularis]|uniref:Mitochondrial import inner membrane translocase subunit TIM22 n=1 Tax=Vigna angularis var. angularis TaxID=157739 RepID=A0A0S3RIP3_PHAAN|nr:hypothetical protein VIGAN_02333800 [Vigna angularis var. angularis]
MSSVASTRKDSSILDTLFSTASLRASSKLLEYFSQHPFLSLSSFFSVQMSFLFQIGAVQAVSREAFFSAVEGNGANSSGLPAEVSNTKKNQLPGLRGETSNKSLEAMVMSTGKESLQWGLAAGLYSGLTYGLKEARGAHDWKNSAVAGAITGATLALTLDDSTHEHIVQCAITGAAISTAANLLTGIF